MDFEEQKIVCPENNGMYISSICLCVHHSQAGFMHLFVHLFIYSFKNVYSAPAITYTLFAVW